MIKNIVIVITVTLLLHAPISSAFDLKDFNGTAVNLDDKIGNDKWTLVMFWAHHCGVCKAEFPTISEFHRNRDDVDVIGISVDGDEKKQLAQQFLDATNPSFPSYITSLTVVAANYQALTQEDFRGTPTFLLFTPEGELLGNNPGKMSVEALAKFISNNS